MEIAELILRFLEVLIWPAVTVFVLVYFKDELTKLFDRAKKVDFPGISIETFEETLEEAQELEKEVKSERKPQISKLIEREIRKKSDVNQRMIELGLRPSPSGLDMNYYRKLAKRDKNLAMSGLRMDLELMIKNLAKGFKLQIEDNLPVSRIINLLLREGKISSKQAEFMRSIFQLTNYAVHGGEVTDDQIDSVLKLGDTLVEDYIAWLDWGFGKNIL